MLDLQKASVSRRISAFLLDIIFVAILITALATLFSFLFGFDKQMKIWDERVLHYETEYGVSFDLSLEETEALSEDEKAYLEKAYAAFSADESAIRAYNMMFALSFVILSLSIFFAILIWEFLLPLYFKNGQTFGKKVFGIALMRTDGVRISTLSLFARAILGKYTIETMIPIMMVLLLVFNVVGVVGLLIIAALFLWQIGMVIATRTNSMIHDALAVTVVVDMNSQKIFDSVEEMIAYKKRIHAEQVAKQDY